MLAAQHRRAEKVLPLPFDLLLISCTANVYGEALSVLLAFPQALYAVQKHVSFIGYATTFEVAETEVTEEHWSHRNGS